MPMTFDTKIAIVLRDDLEMWQKLNITAFLSGGLVGHFGNITGEPYQDGSHNQYMPLVIQPIMIYQATAPDLRKVWERAQAQNVRLAIFTKDLFATSNDIDNRQAVLVKTVDELELVGVAMRDQKKTIDKVIKGLKLHG
jgi:hypothetical protein